MSTTSTGALICDMVRGCAAPITHIDEKGYIYCHAHGVQRREHGLRCRTLAVWERKQLERGEPLASYQPMPKPTVHP